MDDLISRQAVRHILNHEVKMPIKVWKKLFELVDCLPPVTQKPETVTEFADRCRECGAKYGKLLEQKSGKWLLKRTFPTKLYDEHLNEYKCSECYREIRCTESQLVNYPYCHCGARMESEEINGSR